MNKIEGSVSDQAIVEFMAWAMKQQREPRTVILTNVEVSEPPDRRY